MESLRIGLVGWGTVGSALGGLVAAGPLPVRLAWVAVRDPERERSAPLPADVPVGGEPGELGAVDAVVELAGGVDGPREWATASAGARACPT